MVWVSREYRYGFRQTQEKAWTGLRNDIYEFGLERFRPVPGFLTEERRLPKKFR